MKRVRVHLPAYLQPFAGSVAEVEVDGRTVRAVLESLWLKHPALRDRVMTELGEVRPHVNVFVGDESIRFLDGLDTKVSAGAVVHILPAVSGG